jgi:hypothetical protein
MTGRLHSTIEIRRHLPEQLIARVEAATEPGRWHTVIWSARDGWRCSCEVGLRKRCTHIDQVIEHIAT